MIVVILDSEAVESLTDPNHPHHTPTLAVVEANRRTRRKDKARRTAVPTSVRVESGWDRTVPRASFINRLSIEDLDLDGASANLAARFRVEHQVSIADAHIGAAIDSLPQTDEVVVVTSDPADIQLVAQNRNVRIITL